jgi:hypothetical protein
MSPIHPFGHFFEFSATANYVTTIFEDFKKLIIIALSNSGINKLKGEMSLYEQNYDVTVAILENIQKPSPRTHLIEARENKVKLDKVQNKRELLLEKLTDKKLDNTLERKVKPLFFLSGTYSVLLIILCGFSELHENDALYLNMIFVMNSCIAVLACGHAEFFKSQSVKIKTMRFHWIFLGSIVLGFIVGLLIHNYSKTWLSFLPEYTHDRYIYSIFYCMAACGAGFLTLIVKFGVIRLRLAWHYIRIKSIFTKCTRHLNQLADKYIELGSRMN